MLQLLDCLCTLQSKAKGYVVLIHSYCILYDPYDRTIFDAYFKVGNNATGENSTAPSRTSTAVPTKAGSPQTPASTSATQSLESKVEKLQQQQEEMLGMLQQLLAISKKD